jgi:hypothetical protein
MAEKNLSHNSECKSPIHNNHLCFIVAQELHLKNKEEYKSMVKDPHFTCTHCGRVANSDKNLCEPVEL